MTNKADLTSVWKGSNTTYNITRATIANRWGEAEAEKYDPEENCFTYQGWLQRGYQVQKGEKAIKSVTFIEDEDTGDSYPKSVFLFYKKQVKKVKE